VTTLRQLIEEGTTITAYCGITCGGKKDLDLPALAEAYGLDFDLTHQSVAHRLRCTKCGRLGATIRHHQTYRPIPRFDTKGNIG
jgi:hypothetical protein